MKLGKQFGYLTVLSPAASKRGTSKNWLCSCRCGSTVIVTEDQINIQLDCGCNTYRKNVQALKDKPKRERPYKKRPHPSTQYHLEYALWQRLLGRCNNPTHPQYHLWGAVGVTVCGEWSEDFNAFHKWLRSTKWNHKLVVTVVDPLGSFSPENCYISHRKNNRSKLLKDTKFLDNGVDTGTSYFTIFEDCRYWGTLDEMAKELDMCRTELLHQWIENKKAFRAMVIGVVQLSKTI